MRKYMDLVLVKTDKFGQIVYAAPAFSHLEEGDRVVVEGASQPELEGVVVASMTVDANGEEAVFFTKVMNANCPLRKVLRKFRFVEMEWKEDEDDTVSVN